MDELVNDTDKDTRRKGIQSVEIGLRVLNSLAALGEASGLMAVAEASGMSAPQAHRYLHSLIATGMAKQDPGTGRYDLGPGALHLGLGALARLDLFRIADVEISEFARSSGRTVQMAALGPLGPTIVRWNVGRPPVMTSFNVGSVLPMLSSATGLAFLAFTPAGETDHLVDRELAVSRMTRADVEVLRDQVRAAGRAHVQGLQIPGLNATAFPILDLQGRAVLTATALMPDFHRMAPEDSWEAELDALCRSISHQSGWPG